MNWDLAAWLTGSVCALLTIIYGGRHIGRGASEVTEEVDPNQRLVRMLDDALTRVGTLEQDADRGKVRMSNLERDLSFEKDRADRHERQIRSLRTENQELRTELTTLQRVVVAWETWHRWLVSKWHEIRQDETPPAGPQVNTGDN